MNLPQKYKDVPLIEGVLYVHGNDRLNVTDLSKGMHSFPSEHIIASAAHVQKYEYVRLEKDLKYACLFSYRIFSKVGQLKSKEPPQFRKKCVVSNPNQISSVDVWHDFVCSLI